MVSVSPDLSGNYMISVPSSISLFVRICSELSNWKSGRILVEVSLFICGYPKPGYQFSHSIHRIDQLSMGNLEGCMVQ